MKEFEDLKQGEQTENCQNSQLNAKPIDLEATDENSVAAEEANVADEVKNVVDDEKREIAPSCGTEKDFSAQSQCQSQAESQAQPQPQATVRSQAQTQPQTQAQAQAQTQAQNGYGYGYGTPYSGYNNQQFNARPYGSQQPAPQQYRAPQYVSQQYGGGNSYYGQNYSNPAPVQKKKNKGLNIFLVALVSILVIAVVGMGAYIIGNQPTEEDDRTVSQFGQESTNAEVTEVSIPETIKYSNIIIDEYEGLSELYETCSQSCVTVKCTIKSSYYGYTYETPAFGSGFIITEDGYIVTNHHVIENASEIKVVFYDGKEVDAVLVGSDELSDIAVLQIDEDELVPIAIGDSSQLKVGDPVIAIGTPADIALAGTMSYGYISGVNRKIDLTNDFGQVVKTMTLIQTSATLNPGNSGGPLINLAGQVVGINALKLSTEYEGLGFALPMKEATSIINAIIAGEEVNNGADSFVSGAAQLGITGGTVTDEVRSSYNLPEDCPDGVFVTQVNRGTAVYKAGLSVFDIITEFNGTKIATIEELKERIAECKAGQTVSLTYYRPGRSGEIGKSETITFALDSVS